MSRRDRPRGQRQSRRALARPPVALAPFMREAARLESRPSVDEIADGFRMTGFFLTRDLFATRGEPLPDSRRAFLAAAVKAGGG
jgi:hypothetical protein